MEKSFTVQRMEDFMLADHPLLLIRTLVYAALMRMDELFAQMCSRNHERSPAHCAPEKLTHAKFLQVLQSVRWER
ncbi:hypothetical protein ACTUVK_002161 [Stenotrophomonas rhizophila]